MTTFDRLLPLALAHATPHVRRTYQRGCHGVTHWRRVAANGRLIAAATPGADVDVVEAFAVFHDSQRFHDGGDHNHGIRAAELVKALRHKLGLTDTQFAKLVRACRYHNGARPTTDPIVGTCFDADRLDLTRVGAAPDPALLSTVAAKATVERARRAFRASRARLQSGATWRNGDGVSRGT